MEEEKELDKRLPKQFGDFSEGLVMYILGRYKGLRVALVDHVGADVIATNLKTNEVFAISVKGRNIPPKESKQYRFDRNNVEKLNDFATSFNMIPSVAFVFVDKMEGKTKIRLFVLKLDTLKKLAEDEKIEYIKVAYDKGKEDGYNFNYNIKGKKGNHLNEIKQREDIDYTELEFTEEDNNFNI